MVAESTTKVNKFFFNAVLPELACPRHRSQQELLFSKPVLNTPDFNRAFVSKVIVVRWFQLDELHTNFNKVCDT